MTVAGGIVRALNRFDLLGRAMRELAFRKLIGLDGRLTAYRLLGATIGENVYIGASSSIRIPANVTIGEGTHIGRNVLIESWGQVTVGARVIMNDDVTLLTGSHYVDSPTMEGVVRPITIGDYAWLPMHIRILPGVNIGPYAVVGTGAVVTESVPEYTVVGGNPAVKIGDRARHEYTYRVTLRDKGLAG